MTYLKLATVTLAFLSLSTAAQAGNFNTANVQSQVPTTSSTPLKKAKTIRVVRKAIKLPAARNVATHTTRSVLFYNPSETRTKVIHSKTASAKTPNLFRN